ncbi:hypothetical protein [Bacillus subtilis]|uniref:hypothetical protein n=1 Tax=Bacillus subtilis TaxID=1423 RepID=UPI000E2ECC70|nr:hypothetical protein [Bacillus subtilis]MCM3188237.1 hypothetical protein [Bacillus subtilis]CAF1833165.1 hypothetical protein NRS6148_02324 [Bacillus subtilis]
MNDKEIIQKNIVESIFFAFDKSGIRMGDACVYTSYLTKDLLKEKYNMDAELRAGSVKFIYPPVQYKWNPPYETHMWVLLNGEIIDIDAARLTERDEFQIGGKYHAHRNVQLDIVWEDIPYDGRVYTEVENGVDKIEPPIDAPDYKDLYQYACNYIDRN